jgi:hypothetical protein
MRIPANRRDRIGPERVNFSRGHWRSEDRGGAVRSAGWWESVTITWSPTPAPERRPAVLHRALAAAVDLMAPALADLMAEAARHALEQRYRGRRISSSPRRLLPPAARALPRPDRTA